MQMIIDIYVRPDADERQTAIEAALKRAGYAIMPIICENQREGQFWQHKRSIARAQLLYNASIVRSEDHAVSMARIHQEI